MSPDVQLVLLFGALHMVALAFGAVLLVMFLRSDARPEHRPPGDEDSGGGGGGNDRLPRPQPRPTGGLPLPLRRPLHGTHTQADVERVHAPR